MRKAVVATLLIFIVAFYALTALAADNDIKNSVSVRGEGIVEVAPDQAKINIGVVVIGDDLQQVQRQNNEIMAKVKKQLLLAVSEKNIMTGRIYISPLWDYGDKDKKPSIRGYQSENSLSVTLENFDTIGTVLNLCVTAGANQISDIQFLKKDRSAAQDEALKMAVEDSRRKAEAIAAAAGRKIGKALIIKESSSGNYGDEMAMYAMNKGGAGGGNVQVSPGTLQFKAAVDVIYELQ